MSLLYQTSEEASEKANLPMAIIIAHARRLSGFFSKFASRLYDARLESTSVAHRRRGKPARGLIIR
jgi:hypothetical protein